MSTVASGAATMKMMSSTSITSMNGVTLISCSSRERVLAVIETDAHGTTRLLTASAAARAAGSAARAVEIAADRAQHLGRRVAERARDSPRSGARTRCR